MGKRHKTHHNATKSNKKQQNNLPLLVWRNALLVLNLGLHLLDGVARLDVESNGLARESLHKNLHVVVVFLSLGKKNSKLLLCCL
jgi:hypothetical protein